MPPGMFPANILKYDAASVPILQLGLTSKTLREQEIFDLGKTSSERRSGPFRERPSLTLRRQNPSVMVDLNLDELYAKQLSPIDVSNAINLQNLILPAGTAKLGQHRIPGPRQQQPRHPGRAEQSPDQDRQRHTVYIKDVAQVRDGFQVQKNIVRTNGARGVLITITRNGKASTLSIVNQVKAALPRILANVTPDSKSLHSPISPSSSEPPSRASCTKPSSPPA